MDEHTVLKDFLDLKLHKFEEEVKAIVDKAVKETSMEKVLRELDTTWTVMELEHDKHPRTGTTIIRASEEVIETLEDHQVSNSFQTFSVPQHKTRSRSVCDFLVQSLKLKLKLFALRTKCKT
jgi:hypothetical protein